MSKRYFYLLKQKKIVNDLIHEPLELNLVSDRGVGDLRKFYKKDEWGIREDTMIGDPDDRIYVDKNDKPITGILENFYYFKEGDERNNVYVENGKH